MPTTLNRRDFLQASVCALTSGNTAASTEPFARQRIESIEEYCESPAVQEAITTIHQQIERLALPTYSARVSARKELYQVTSTIAAQMYPLPKQVRDILTDVMATSNDAEVRLHVGALQTYLLEKRPQTTRLPYTHVSVEQLQADVFEQTGMQIEVDSSVDTTTKNDVWFIQNTIMQHLTHICQANHLSPVAGQPWHTMTLAPNKKEEQIQGFSNGIRVENPADRSVYILSDPLQPLSGVSAAHITPLHNYSVVEFIKYIQLHTANNFPWHIFTEVNEPQNEVRISIPQQADADMYDWKAQIHAWCATQQRIYEYDWATLQAATVPNASSSVTQLKKVDPHTVSKKSYGKFLHRYSTHHRGLSEAAAYSLQLGTVYADEQILNKKPFQEEPISSQNIEDTYTVPPGTQKIRLIEYSNLQPTLITVDRDSTRIEPTHRTIIHV